MFREQKTRESLILMKDVSEWILNNFVCDGYQFPLYYRWVLYQPKYIASDFREDMEKNKKESN